MMLRLFGSVAHGRQVEVSAQGLVLTWMIVRTAKTESPWIWTVFFSMTLRQHC
jgi:hypothetical protein